MVVGSIPSKTQELKFLGHGFELHRPSMKGTKLLLKVEVGGWGRDPKKCTGRDWGMRSSTI